MNRAKWGNYPPLMMMMLLIPLQRVHSLTNNVFIFVSLFSTLLSPLLSCLLASFILPSLPRRYKEVCKYNFNNPGWSSGTGHFTQIVWKKSLELGIGGVRKGRCTFVVARYKPAGNVRNGFRDNVAKGTFNERNC